jgi:hypothetical protein
LSVDGGGQLHHVHVGQIYNISQPQ